MQMNVNEDIPISSFGLDLAVGAGWARFSSDLLREGAPHRMSWLPFRHSQYPPRSDGIGLMLRVAWHHGKPVSWGPVHKAWLCAFDLGARPGQPGHHRTSCCPQGAFVQVVTLGEPGLPDNCLGWRASPKHAVGPSFSPLPQPTNLWLLPPQPPTATTKNQAGPDGLFSGPLSTLHLHPGHNLTPQLPPPNPFPVPYSTLPPLQVPLRPSPKAGRAL